MKLENFQNREMLANITQSVMYLEKAHTEMKTFIQQVLNEVFRTVEK